MAYSAEVVRRARRRLEEQKEQKRAETASKLQQVYAELPHIRELDAQLRKTMILAAQAVFTQGDEGKAAMEEAKKANLALQKQRKAAIDARFGPEFLDESEICDRCGGTGYLGSQMCNCLMELCRQEQKKELSLLNCGEGDFEQFKLEYYPAQTDSRYGASPRTIMQKNLELSKRFVRNFGAGNLLFVGGTGLGKTYMSACIARSVADSGHSVAYEPAGRLFAKLERNRFNPSAETEEEMRRLQDCDLLIVDDLGTELPGNFVTAALYGLLNDRLLAGKPMVISTNLNIDEIAQRYSPQIASRLQGHFKVLPFVGEDIRVMKNRGIVF
ncbi:MAG: ATP-binding protein [Oscillospiraceae bacterium]|nr:ATP-binding protein [Oscillospiraceae bacterium]